MRPHTHPPTHDLLSCCRPAFVKCVCASAVLSALEVECDPDGGVEALRETARLAIVNRRRADHPDDDLLCVHSRAFVLKLWQCVRLTLRSLCVLPRPA